MSADNVAILKGYVDCLNRGEIDKAIELFDPDFVGDFTNSINPDLRGVYRGRDAIRELFERFFEPWDELEWINYEWIDAGDIVVEVAGLRVRGESSGIETTSSAAQVWEFRDGRPVSTVMYQTKEDALAAMEADPS